jgi:tetratricopeptide (TPR) repeat protein
MRVFPLSIALLVALPGAAFAGDKPVIGPVPAWVKPVALPTASDKDDSAPVRLLLTDKQISLQPGKIAIYDQVAIKIQNPQGLAAGNVSLPWRPDTDELIVHKLLIHRGDKVIDVLAGGQTFTVLRRETNLEIATLDGVLTANIQPEGLQVGDVLELATTVISSDPVLKGHVESADGWNGLGIARGHIRVSWPANLKAHVRTAGALPVVTPTTANDVTSVELMQDDIKPIVPPKGAPDRYALTRVLEVSDFASWADMGALLAPLYDKAATLKPDSPLLAEIARIKAASSDPKARAEAALALAQDRIRYVALLMGEGGLTPADADTTWGRRYGDCKAKTALLLALLKGLGIAAEPVVVNAVSGDGFDQRLPMIALFNHVLVRATIAGKAYWLDGTRTGDTSLDRLKIPGFDWGLPLVASGAALVRMLPAPLDLPSETITARIDASGGITLPAPFKADILYRGNIAIGANTTLSQLTGDARDSALRKFWRGRYDFVDIKSATASFDPKTGEERLTMEGLANMDWNDGWYETDGMRVGYRADFSRDPGPNSDAPYAVVYPLYEKTVETIILPPGFPDQTPQLVPDVNETVAGIEYRRHASMTGSTVTIEKTERSLVPEFPAKDAPAAEKRLRELSSKGVYLKRPSNYQPTKTELDKRLSDTPTSATGFNDRGLMLMTQKNYEAAIADFTRALVLDDKNVVALTNRGISHVCKNQYDAAAKDFDAVEAIDPKNPGMLGGRALLAESRGVLTEALATYGRALTFDPKSTWLLERRARLNLRLGQRKAALADVDAILAGNPTSSNMHGLKAMILIEDGQREQARVEATAFASSSPADANAQAMAGTVYGLLHDFEAARAAFDRAIAIAPEARYYVLRSQYRKADDLVARARDLDTAIKIDPTYADAWSAKAEMASDNIDLNGALVLISKAVALAPNNPRYLLQRAYIEERKGSFAAARKDVETVLMNDSQNMSAKQMLAGISQREAASAKR